MSSLMSSTSNYSVYAIPLYWVFSILPHLYAVNVASHGNPSKWDNRNPRASGLKSSLAKNLSPTTYARYERAEAAHYNSLESFPLFAAAVVLGNVARLPAGTLNTFVVGFGVVRAAYSAAYVTTARQEFTWFRTGLWFVATGWSVSVLWKAAAALA